MGIQLLFLRCYSRINDNRGLPNTGCQEVYVQGFSASSCPWILLFLLPGTRSFWQASQVQTSVSSLSTAGAGGIYKALHGGAVAGCCASAHRRRTRLLSHPVERLSQSKSATGQRCCYHRRACKLSCDCREDKVGPESNWGTKSSSSLPSILTLTVFLGYLKYPHHPPHQMLRCSWGKPGTCHGLRTHQLFAMRRLGTAPVEWKVAVNSPGLVLLSPRSLVEEFIVINAITLNTNRINYFLCIGQHCLKHWLHIKPWKQLV